MTLGLLDEVFAEKTREEWVDSLSQHKDLIWERRREARTCLATRRY